MPGSSTAPPPDRCPSHNDGLGKVLGILFATGLFVVGESDVWANKHIVAHTQTVPQLHAAFDGDTVADDNVIFDQAVGADVAVLANLRAGKDNDELPNSRVCADGEGLDVGQGVDEGWLRQFGYS